MEQTKKDPHSLRFLNWMQWLPLLIARLSVGTIFAEAGWGKMHHLPKVIEFFTSIGIPFAAAQAPMVAFFELIGGSALILGIGTRFFSALLTGVMGVAIWTAKKDEIKMLTDLFGMSEYLYIVIFVILICTGAGALSVDQWIKHRRNSPDWNS